MQVIKIPGINGAGKTKGCEQAGNAILFELKKIYSNEQGEKIEVGKLDLEEIHLDNGNLKLTNKLIYENSFEAFEIKPRVVFLGGDHSISYSTTRAFFDHVETAGKEPCLIVFDAHPDLMAPCKKPESYPSSKEWLRGLIEKGFPVGNILLIGIRNSNSEETLFLRENKIKTISMTSFLEEDFVSVCDSITEFAYGKELYVSLDIDVVDPAFAPSTADPESGGLTNRQIIYLVQRINKIKTLRAFDLVEINTEKDKENNNLTVKLGAKILSELI